MWTVSQIAARDGISKQAVSKHVARLIEQGLDVQRNSAGHVVAINVVGYDHLRARVADPSKAQAPAPRVVNSEETYDEALRLKTLYEAEKRRLELEERKGQLLPADGVKEAASRAAEEIGAIADRLPNATDDFAAAVAREGSHGLRVALKEYARKQRSEFAAALSRIAEEARRTPIEDAA